MYTPLVHACAGVVQLFYIGCAKVFFRLYLGGMSSERMETKQAGTENITDAYYAKAREQWTLLGLYRIPNAPLFPRPSTQPYTATRGMKPATSH